MSDPKQQKRPRTVFDNSFISHNTIPTRINDIALKCAGIFHKHISNTSIEAEFRLGTFRWREDSMPDDLKQDWIQKSGSTIPPRYSRGNMSEVMLDTFDEALTTSQDYVFDATIVPQAAANLRKLIEKSFKNLSETIIVEREVTLDEIYNDPSSDGKLRLTRKMRPKGDGFVIDETQPPKCIRKRRLENTDILMPNAAYDLRLIFSTEEDIEISRIDRNQENIVCREKDRFKYCCSLGTLDLTMVKTYIKGDKENAKTTFEAEFECSGLVLGHLDENYSTSLYGEYATVISKIVNAARELAYAASPVNNFV